MADHGAFMSPTDDAILYDLYEKRNHVKRSDWEMSDFMIKKRHAPIRQPTDWNKLKNYFL